MKNLVKILIIMALAHQGLAQSKIDMRTNDIVINRPLRIEHTNTPFAMVVKSPANTASVFSFINDNITVGNINREGNSLKFYFEGGVDFNFGFPFITTSVTATGVRTDGSLQSKDLSFTTTNTAQIKPVFADRNGKLVIDNATNHYQNYHPTAAQPTDNTAPIRKNAAYAWFNSTNAVYEMLIPLNIPDNVKVTNVRMWCAENSTTGNLELDFRKNSNINQATNTIATVTSSGAISTLTSINVNSNELIDNQNFSYYVSISSVGNWDGPSMALHNLIITYQYQ